MLCNSCQRSWHWAWTCCCTIGLCCRQCGCQFVYAKCKLLFTTLTHLQSKPFCGSVWAGIILWISCKKEKKKHMRSVCFAYMITELCLNNLYSVEALFCFCFLNSFKLYETYGMLHNRPTIRCACSMIWAAHRCICHLFSVWLECCKVKFSGTLVHTFNVIIKGHI